MTSVYRRTLTALIFHGLTRLICCQEEVEAVDVNANKWDLKPLGTGGCGAEDGNGCGSQLSADGLLNDVPASRWSCHDALLPDGSCYISYDLGVPYTLSHLAMYFYKSNESTRHVNNFTVSVSNDSEIFVEVMSAWSTIPIPLKESDDFPFDPGVAARHVRITKGDSDNRWLSVNEVKIFVNESVPTPGPVVPTPSPSMPPTAFPTSVSTPGPGPPSQVPTIEPTYHGNESLAPLTLSPAAAETPAPTVRSTEYDYLRPGGEDLGIVAATFGGGFALLSLVAMIVISLSKKALNPVLNHPLGDSRRGDFA